MPFQDDKPEPMGRDLVRPGSLVIKDKIYTVSEITAVVKAALETAFPQVWVEGEASNVRAAASGHVYLTLKDAAAQLSAVVWRSDAARLKFEFKDGQQFVCRGKIDVYAARGAYQLIIDRAEPKGKGALQLAFEQLKEKLRAEGLFDPARKRALPLRPKTIGVVTSPSGAALIDILRTLERRAARLHVLIYPARVQGEGAADDIVAGIDYFAGRPGIDALIVGRGGGSIEDLWAFNEERVARAIVRSPIPVISAVGHEVDFTIADFAADIRASTPTAAAEMVIEKEEAFVERIDNLERRVRQCIKFAVQDMRHGVESLVRHRVFQNFKEQLLHLDRRVDDLEVRALDSIRERRRQMADARARAALAGERLAAGLRERLREAGARTVLGEERAAASFRAFLQARKAAWEKAAAGLHGNSPLNVLKKGFAVVRDGASRRPVVRIDGVAVDAEMIVSFFKGEFRARVTGVDPDKPAVE